MRGQIVREKHRAERDERIRKASAEGLSARQLSERFGLSMARVREILKVHNEDTPSE